MTSPGAWSTKSSRPNSHFFGNGMNLGAELAQSMAANAGTAPPTPMRQTSGTNDTGVAADLPRKHQRNSNRYHSSASLASETSTRPPSQMSIASTTDARPESVGTAIPTGSAVNAVPRAPTGTRISTPDDSIKLEEGRVVVDVCKEIVRHQIMADGTHRFQDVSTNREKYSWFARAADGTAQPLRTDRWTAAEDEALLDGYTRHGDKWLRVSRHVPGRTDRGCRERVALLLNRKAAGRPYTKRTGIYA